MSKHHSRKGVRPLAAATLAAMAVVAVPAVADAGTGQSPVVTVAPSTQAATLRANRVLVNLRAPRGTSVRVRAFANVNGSSTQVSYTSTATVGRSGSRTLSLPLSKTGRSLLSRCGLKVSLSAAATVGRRTVESGSANLASSPNSCGRKAPKTIIVPGPTKTITVPGETNTVEVPGPTVEVPGPTVEVPGPTVEVPGPVQIVKPTPKPENLFKVGTSVKDITPTGDMIIGGYGAGFKVTGGAHDPLQVRAFFVGKGDKANVFVSVDAQGWFAANQTPSNDDGQDAARAAAAAELTAAGFPATSANVILSNTHTHAAPTLQGIWGNTDPAYLHRVKLATIEAVKDAAAKAQDAQLWTATGSAKGLVSQVQGTDQMAGFAIDDNMPMLWARKPGTGATIGLYVDVPTHADQYNPTAAGNNQYSADYPGYVRKALDDTLGGTTVVGAGTLGRQESIGASPAYDEVAQQGRFITNQINRALSRARKMTDTTIAAGQQQFTTAATNTGLLAGMMCNHGAAAFGCTEPASNNGNGTWFWSGGSIFTINRSLSAPYYNAGSNLTNGTIGTSSTVARIGDQLFATAPGEAFPEVASAIRRTFSATDGIRGVHIIDHAGDQLGYYWDARTGVYPTAQLAQSDFAKFQVGPNLAQDNVNAARAAGATIGLTGTNQNAFAEIDNPNAFNEPTIQFYTNRIQSASKTVSLYVTSKKAQQPGSTSTTIGSSSSTQNDGKVSWDFGDGTTDVLTSGVRFDHTYAAAGTYRVQASVTDNLGKTYRWVQNVTIDAPLTAAVDTAKDDDGKLVLTPRAVGGQRYDVLAAHWSFDDGSADADGTSIVRDVPTAPLKATVTITDGAGNTATDTVTIPAGG